MNYKNAVRFGLAVGLGILSASMCVSCRDSAQAYKDDVQSICDGPTLLLKRFKAKSLDEVPGELYSKNQLIVAAINEALKTKQGLELFHSLGKPTTEPGERASKLETESLRLGIASCKYADFLRSAPESSKKPEKQTPQAVAPK